MKTKITVIFIIFLAIFLGCNRNVDKKDFVLQGEVFGTTYKITYLNASKDYQNSLDSLFLAFNQSLSTYIPTSDISKINDGDLTVEVDDFFVEVFEKSKRIHQETDGFFDPTVGNLVNAYGFGPEKGNFILSDSLINEFMKDIGFEKVSLKGRKINKENPNVFLDFNSIAKGFAIDIIARFFDSKKVDNYLIEIGGEIRSKGSKKDNKPWVIQIVNPSNVQDENGFTILKLADISMATSGNYRKYRVTDDGKKYVHTVNPKTGLATESNLLSASVFTKTNCADADAYATAFMAMGFEKSKQFLEKNLDIKAILIYTDEFKNIQVFDTFYTD
ncbi:MAG: FAD:protein FMN transferase [Polaribacter sp.]|nr:FAD:protein FMN transferase [Polaribacter sp.]